MEGVEVDIDKQKNIPGSDGEHKLQRMYGTQRRAENFYNKQVLNYLNERMCGFVNEQDMAFIATSDKKGECDCSFRAGMKNSLYILSKKRIIFPEYRGNGVMASAGNVAENPHMGMIFIDFSSTIGLHINGSASVVANDVADNLLAERGESLDLSLLAKGRRPEFWFSLDIEEAYIHCSKHIPLMRPIDRDIDWGTDDVVKKGGDAFEAKNCARPWVKEAVNMKP
jgi:Pyridoxamine 5''-phosphate oxidase.